MEYRYNDEIPKAITVKEFAQKYSIGLNKAYEIVNSMGFPMIKAGRKIIVLNVQADEWMTNQIGRVF